MSNPIYDAALEYVDEGISVIPMKGKIPQVNMSLYRDKLPTLEELTKWFDVENPPNIGVLNGSSRLWSVECNSTVANNWFKKLIPEPLEKVAVFRTLCGLIYLFKLPEDIERVRSRVVVVHTAQNKITKERMAFCVEICGNGTITCLPPSVSLPSRTIYYWINRPPFKELAVVSPRIILDRIGPKNAPIQANLEPTPQPGPQPGQAKEEN
ncbi:MAG: bifunctional DNA primase/polymerase [Deltaproteobacteria bacterium]|jgi:hypothetical protein|nr:bifunctional DNA primase/polymerase [Deltaproteobacteria bacterium]